MRGQVNDDSTRFAASFSEGDFLTVVVGVESTEQYQI